MIVRHDFSNAGRELYAFTPLETVHATLYSLLRELGLQERHECKVIIFSTTPSACDLSAQLFRNLADLPRVFHLRTVNPASPPSSSSSILDEALPLHEFMKSPKGLWFSGNVLDRNVRDADYIFHLGLPPSNNSCESSLTCPTNSYI
jgi:hypothetical protein